MATFDSAETLQSWNSYCRALAKAFRTFQSGRKPFFFIRQHRFGSRREPLLLFDHDPQVFAELESAALGHGIATVQPDRSVVFQLKHGRWEIELLEGLVAQIDTDRSVRFHTATRERPCSAHPGCRGLAGLRPR